MNNSAQRKQQLQNAQQSQQTQQSTKNNPLLVRQLQKFMKKHTLQTQQKCQQIFNLYAVAKQLFTQINNLLIFTQQVSESIVLCRQFQKQKNREQNEAGLKISGQVNKQLKPIPIVVIKDIKTQKRVKQTNINNVANKLKVLVSKTMQKQLSLFQYNYSSYLNLLRQQIADIKSNDSLQSMRDQLVKIKKIFFTVNAAEAINYRHHPSKFVYAVNANFFVSFYTERLLFFQDQPLPFNGNLLFVPVIFTRQKNKNIQTNKIAFTMVQSSFIKQLCRYNQNWENFCLELIFKDSQHSKIIHYFCAHYQKKLFQIQICAMLRKIRCFVYFSLIFNYLSHVIDQSTISESKKSLRINITEQVYLQINTYRVVDNDKLSNPKIFQDFIKYFDEKSIKQRVETTRQQARFNFQNHIKLMLTKLKYSTNVPQKYAKLRPKYIYIGNQRVEV